MWAINSVPAKLRNSVWNAVVIGCVGISFAAHAQVASPILTGPTQAVYAGSEASIWAHFLNTSDHAISVEVPRVLRARVSAGVSVFETDLQKTVRDAAGRSGQPLASNLLSIPAGGFARTEYLLMVPGSLEGQAVLEVPALGANRVVLDVRPPPAPETAPSTTQPGFVRFLKQGLLPEREYAPMEFFKQHFFGYEPIYFIGGWTAPELKFQISLRYQLLNKEGPLAQKAPFLSGLNFAYTQVSLWDFGQYSSPFLDTSYKPELMYLWERVDRGRWGDRLRLDLQGGVQHESNGNPEIDSRLLDIGERVSYYVENGHQYKTSRSLNILYLRPTLVLGKSKGFQLAVSPRVWAYLGDISDNPDIKDYRGYMDLRTTVGWADGLQLTTTGRLGDDWNHGSLQFDLSYPMMKLFSGSLSVYLYAQYFTGYGESLLLYNHKSDAVRFGVALYR